MDRCRNNNLIDSIENKRENSNSTNYFHDVKSKKIEYKNFEWLKE